MKLHPRTQPVGSASAYTRSALLDIQDEFELTDVEMLRILLEAAERVSKHLLRAERHPDNQELKGDEACNGLCRHDLPTPPDRCSDCGRGARHLEPVYETVHGVREVAGWLGPGCYRKHLARAERAVAMPLGGGGHA